MQSSLLDGAMMALAEEETTTDLPPSEAKCQETTAEAVVGEDLVEDLEALATEGVLELALNAMKTAIWRENALTQTEAETEETEAEVKAEEEEASHALNATKKGTWPENVPMLIRETAKAEVEAVEEDPEHALSVTRRDTWQGNVLIQTEAETEIGTETEAGTETEIEVETETEAEADPEIELTTTATMEIQVPTSVEEKMETQA